MIYCKLQWEEASNQILMRRMGMRMDGGVMRMEWMPVEVYPSGYLFVPYVNIAIAIDGEIRLQL